MQEFRLIQKYAADPVVFRKKASDDDISPIDLERGLHGIVTGCLFGMMQLRGLFFLPVYEFASIFINFSRVITTDRYLRIKQSESNEVLVS